MGQVTIRTSYTSRGILGLAPYSGNYSSYEICNINLGSNPLSKIEIVSALNSINLGRWEYLYNHVCCPQKYNPKLYLSAFQSMAPQWNYDNNSGLSGEQKSGSWPYSILHYISCIIDYC